MTITFRFGAPLAPGKTSIPKPQSSLRAAVEGEQPKPLIMPGAPPTTSYMEMAKQNLDAQKREKPKSTPSVPPQTSPQQASVPQANMGDLLEKLEADSFAKWVKDHPTYKSFQKSS